MSNTIVLQITVHNTLNNYLNQAIEQGIIQKRIYSLVILYKNKKPQWLKKTLRFNSFVS